MKLTMLGVVAATCIENDLAEHMDVPSDTRKMPNHELQFHYLERHDFDNQLDGCEVIKALIHWHEQGNKDSHDGLFGGIFCWDVNNPDISSPICGCTKCKFTCGVLLTAATFHPPAPLHKKGDQGTLYAYQ